MEEHWRAGYFDTVRSPCHTEALSREGVATFDLVEQGGE
jgi:NTE family protein